ncbi:MAG: DUF547 domain-containing protein [Myxococcota bacterium]
MFEITEVDGFNTRMRQARWLGLVVAGVVIGAAAPAWAFDHSHERFDGVLRKYVDGGGVRYGALDKDRQSLDSYIQSLGDLPVSEFEKFSREEAMAFWINAYNALTLQLILDKHPSKSIRDIDDPWDKPKFRVVGKAMSLNDIEHETLRKRFKDARVHAVLVCAAKSCPILQNRAYVAKDLDQQLNRACQRWARDKTRNRFDKKDNELQVSKIFSWYGKDFIEQYAARGGGKGVDAAIRGFMREFGELPISTDENIAYLDYDWRLNGHW